jgi:hypothetical protein
MRTILTFILLLISVGAWAALPTDFQPQTAPLTPPDIDGATVEAAPAAPAPEYRVYNREQGLFGRSLDARVTGFYLYNRTGQRGLLGLLGASCNFIVRDPLKLGSFLGLSEDALEYQVGPGLEVGNGIDNQAFFSLPLNLGAILYYKENSFFGRTPFIGAMTSLNLFGTENRSGGLGFQFFGGIESNLELPGGGTSLAIGYGSYRITDTLFSEGLIFSLSQPVRL